MPPEPTTLTSGDRSTARPGSGRFVPGTRGFLIVLSAAMGMTALAIDGMLPAFGDIRAEFGYAPDSTAVTGLVTAFMAGLGVGQLPAGLLADRFGRRPVLWGGIVVYVVGAVASMIAPSLPLMIAARFVWGLGSAGPRVAALSMVRDSYQGEQMAKQMSTIMAVFLIVPMVAPTLGTAAMSLGSWRLVFVLMIGVACVVLAFSTGLPSTMPVGARRPLSASAIWSSWKTVLGTPGTFGYLVAMAAQLGAFLAYIGASEAIISDIYDLEAWFPLIFGGVALVLAVAILLNGRFVEQLGLGAILRAGPTVLLLCGVVFLVVALLGDGRPPFAAFVVSILGTLVMMQVLLTNINSAAMVPLGGVAGSGSALLGMIPMVAGALIASFINAQVSDTITPFGWAFVAAGVMTILGVRWALRVAPLDRRATADTTIAH